MTSFVLPKVNGFSKFFLSHGKADLFVNKRAPDSGKWKSECSQSHPGWFYVKSVLQLCFLHKDIQRGDHVKELIVIKVAKHAGIVVERIMPYLANAF